MQDCMAVSRKMRDTEVVCVMDREGDFFELFEHWRQNPCVQLLVRAKHDRRSSEDDFTLFESVRKAPVQAQVSIDVPRRSAKPKKGKRPARAARPARTAQVSLRYKPVKLCPPKHGLNSGKEPVAVWLVHLIEDNPPQGQEPIEWFLLTTKPVTSIDDALRCVEWYRLRWRVEDWHRVIKSGCGAEKHAHRTAERIKRALAFDLVVAWRIMLMTLLGREAPELPAEVLFSDIEIEVLSRCAQKKNLARPDCIGNAVKIVASLGGYLGRANDPPPGHQLMWRGYSCLMNMVLGAELIRDASLAGDRYG